MSENDWDAKLAAAAEDVLETMFFSGIYGPAAAPPDGAALAARVAFRGTPCGTLTLRLSEPSARSLASNFLACESAEPLPQTQLAGVVCELANMVCGSLLSRVKSETDFRLSAPELLPCTEPEPAAGTPAHQAFDLGDGVLDLCLELENHAG